MRLEPYPQYKNSNAQWLDEYPSGWRTSRLSRLLLGIKDGTHGTFERVSDGRPLLSAKNIQNWGIKIGESESRISEDDFQSIISSGYPSYGDVALTIVGTVGRSCVYRSTEPMAFQRSVCFLRPVPELDAEFLNFQIQSGAFQEQLRLKTKVSAQPGVYMGDVSSIETVFPPYDEQIAVSSFLNRETAEIDAFIADQEELIALLVERRTATITQAVARGLHPDVRMVAGSLAEIGSVPIHWSVSRLKWGITKIESGTSVNAHDIPVKGTDEVGVLKTSCVYTGEFDPSKNKKVNVEDLHRVACPVQANTLIISRMNTPQLVGAAGYAVRNEPNIYLPDRLWQVYFHESWEARFVHFWTQTRLYRAQVEAVCMGTSSSMQNIGQDDLQNFILHLPPKEEQREIVNYLKTATSDIDAAIADAREAIALSQERRAAVISAAVTGKIDVRGLVGPEANNVEDVSVGIA